jgi:hypothetical protein
LALKCSAQNNETFGVYASKKSIAESVITARIEKMPKSKEQRRTAKNEQLFVDAFQGQRCVEPKI